MVYGRGHIGLHRWFDNGCWLGAVVKPSRRNREAETRAKEKAKGRAPLLSKYAAKVRGSKDGPDTGRPASFESGPQKN